jgi:hypothetical protein
MPTSKALRAVWERYGYLRHGGEYRKIAILQYMKNAFLKLSILAVLSAIIGCTSGEGYDPPSEDGECPDSYWADNWSSLEFISFFDDSLAIYTTKRYKVEYFKEYFLFEGNRCVGYAIGHHVGLWFANYRSKQKPLLVDTLDYGLTVISSYFKDSSLFVIKDNKFGFWKIGKNSISFNKEIEFSESIYTLDRSFDIANPWIDDNVLKKNYEYYTVLNTKTGKVEKLDTLGQDGWMSACKDMSYINGKIFCLRHNAEEDFYELIVDNVVTDTSSFSNGAYFYGNYVTGRTDGKQIRRILKIDSENFKFDKTFTLWFSEREMPAGITFYNDKNNIDDYIEYSEEDFK